VNLTSLIRPGAAVRGAGIALACMLPGVGRRAAVIATSYAAAWPVDRPGLQLFVVVPDEDEEPWRRAAVPLLTSGGSWTVAMSLAALGVRRIPLPTPVAAVLLGGGIAAVDSVLEGWAERLKARAVAARTAREGDAAEG
jgi:hypothetical protein